MSNSIRPAMPPNSKCPNAETRKACPLICKYNFFESEDEEFTIHAWELKCTDCGWRDTIGYRSDEMDEDDQVDPKQCPFCHQCGLSPGKNPCQ